MVHHASYRAPINDFEKHAMPSQEQTQTDNTEKFYVD